MKILFVGPKFNEYQNDISESLRALGHTVKYREEEDVDILYRISKKLFPKYVVYRREVARRSISNELASGEYDVLFVIRGVFFEKSFVDSLKILAPHTKFVMYQWDSIKHYDFSDMVESFDVCRTFDVDDSKDLSLSYLPLFASDDYHSLSTETIAENEQIIFDVCFVGAYHSDRLSVLRKFVNCNPNAKVKFIVVIPFLSFVLNFIKRRITLADLKYLRLRPLSRRDVVNLYRTTRAVLDIELNIQSGITMRCHEVLAARRKLISTNPNVLSLSDGGNILVVDRNLPQLPSGYDFNYILDTPISVMSVHCWVQNAIAV